MRSVSISNITVKKSQQVDTHSKGHQSYEAHAGDLDVPRQSQCPLASGAHLAGGPGMMLAAAACVPQTWPLQPTVSLSSSSCVPMMEQKLTFLLKWGRCCTSLARCKHSAALQDSGLGQGKKKIVWTGKLLYANVYKNGTTNAPKWEGSFRSPLLKLPNSVITCEDQLLILLDHQKH